MTTGRQLRFWLIGVLLAGIALYVLRDIMLPFVAGMAVAYFLDPAADRLERWGLSRALSTTVITASFFIVFIVLALLLAPVLQGQLVGFVERLPTYVERAREALMPRAGAILQLAGIEEPADIGGAMAGYANNLMAWLAGLLKQLWSGGLALVNLLSLIVITPVVAFYLLRDWDRMVAQIDGWLPRPHAQTVRDQLAEIDRVLAGFARGQAIVCLILAVYYGVALSLVGVEFGLFIGIASGLISFIPYIGAVVGFVASVGVAAVQFWPDYLPIGLVLAIYLAGQVVESGLLTPRLVGDRVGLHPVWLIFGLFAGGALFGFVGVLIAVPAAAVIGVVARFLLSRYLRSHYYLGIDGGAGESPPEPDRDVGPEKEEP